MKGFERENRWFSLCGLNCALCPMYLGRYCPGCGQGEGNQSCAIARCSLKQEKVEYCFLCKEFPCEQYREIDCFDSFITHLNQLKDIERAKQIGIPAYCREQQEKEEILQYLLQNYNDGRRKTLYCTAVNLLSLQGLRVIVERLKEKDKEEEDIKGKAAFAAQLLQEQAEQQGISLKLRKKKNSSAK